MNDIEINNSIFLSIKHIDKEGIEIWYARELQIVLKYIQWRNFYKVIEKSVVNTNNNENIK